MPGLKPVRQRRGDALSRITWERLEALLATHYRDAGYAVDHCGTGATGQVSDGGVDLRLRRDDQYVLVQCKHWNAYQVPHNDVHQLLGVMVNEGATGAILVTSGEFTPAARQAAAKLGHVQLIDGDQLRAMIGPLPEPEMSLQVRYEPSPVLERRLAATEDRISYGRHSRPSGRRAKSGTGLKLLGAALMLLAAWFLMQHFLAAVRRPLLAPARPQRVDVQPAPVSSAAADQAMCWELVEGPGTYIDNCAPTRPARSPAELRELQRRADEAIKVLEDSTPEL